MSTVEKISIALPGEMLETIRDAVDAGEYASTSEVIRDALRAWKIERVWQSALRAHGIERLRAMVEEDDDGDGGIPAADLRAELTARYKGMAERQGGKKRRA